MQLGDKRNKEHTQTVNYPTSKQLL